MAVIDWILQTLRSYPELAIFLTLGLGYWVGALRLGSFSLGSVTGVLLAGILVGQIGIEISSQVKSVFFVMFLFAVGYGVGPQFVRGIATDGLPQALFAVLISVLCLACAYAAIVVQGYDVGLGAGLYAGATTISASIGLASDAIRKTARIQQASDPAIAQCLPAVASRLARIASLPLRPSKRTMGNASSQAANCRKSTTAMTETIAAA